MILLRREFIKNKRSILDYFLLIQRNSNRMNVIADTKYTVFLMEDYSMIYKAHEGVLKLPEEVIMDLVQFGPFGSKFAYQELSAITEVVDMNKVNDIIYRHHMTKQVIDNDFAQMNEQELDNEKLAIVEKSFNKINEREDVLRVIKEADDQLYERIEDSFHAYHHESYVATAEEKYNEALTKIEKIINKSR